MPVGLVGAEETKTVGGAVELALETGFIAIHAVKGAGVVGGMAIGEGSLSGEGCAGFMDAGAH